MTSDTCLRCGNDFGIGFHHCLSEIFITHPESLIKSRKEANPLDRLSFDDMMEILDEDTEEIFEGAEVLLAEFQEEYLQGPLTYRVELQTITGVGFQGGVDIYAVEAGGCSDTDLGLVLNFLNSGINMIMSLRKDEAYLCRLVSVSADGIKYVWSTNRLEFEGKWTISAWD